MPEQISKMFQEAFLETKSEATKKFLNIEGTMNSSFVLQHRKFDTTNGVREKTAKAFMARMAREGSGTIERRTTARSCRFRKKADDSNTKLQNNKCKTFLQENSD